MWYNHTHTFERAKVEGHFSNTIKWIGSLERAQKQSLGNCKTMIPNAFHQNFYLNAYKQSPASKSKRRRWGYGGMLMSEGVKAPSDKLRSSMRS